MSEAAADSLKHELSELETQFPEPHHSRLTNPTRGWQKPSDRFAKIRHAQP